MPRKIVSFDITKSDLKATVIETGFRDFKVAGFYRESLNGDPAGIAAHIGKFIDEYGSDADTVLSALPAEVVSWRTLYLPFRDNRKVAQTVPFELENNVPFGLDDVVVDYHVLHRDASGTTVLAALAPKSEVERHLQVLQDAGVDPKVVAASPLAALNTLHLVPDRPPTFAFVDGSQLSATVALYRNGSLVGVRSLTAVDAFAGAGNGDGAASPGAEESDARSRSVGASLAANVRWTLLAMNGAPLDEGLPCYLAGPVAWVEAVAGDLERVLNVEVRRLDQLQLESIDAGARADASAFGASLGLALREITPGDTVGVNFRRGEFIFHRSEQELKAGLRTVAILALLVVALTVGELYTKYRESQVRLAAVEDEIYQVFEATLPDVGRVGRPLDVLGEEISQLRQDVEMLDDVVPIANSTSVDLLRAVSAAVPNSVRIDSNEYLMDPGSVRLTAETDTFESVDSLKQKFFETGFFSDVQVKDAKTTKTGISFRMMMILNKNFRPPGSTR